MPHPESWASTRGVLFDAYGTLLDVSGVRAACAEVTDRPEELAARWRAKQLEYTWLLTLMDRFEPFERVTGRALKAAAAALDLSLDPAAALALQAAWLTLDPMPEAEEALAAMRDGGLSLAVLSNGTRAMLDPALARAGLAPLLDRVVTVEEIRVYKPSPRVYAHGLEAVGLSAGQALFVSGNSFDACGATAAGLRVAWLDRAGAGLYDPLDLAPAIVARDLNDVARRVFEA